jgi:hypothetical protein
LKSGQGNNLGTLFMASTDRKTYFINNVAISNIKNKHS